MPRDAPPSGDDFVAPVPGADYDPDSALMAARAMGALQDQMRWVVETLGPLEKEVLVDANGKKFEALAAMMGTQADTQRKWRIAGGIEKVAVVNPGTLRGSMLFDTGIAIGNLYLEFDMAVAGQRLYLEGVLSGTDWSVTLKADKAWNTIYPIRQIGDDFFYTTFYYPIAVTHNLTELESAGITPVISNETLGVVTVAPDADLTLNDGYFLNPENSEGSYMIYPTPLPGDIYIK